MVGDLPVAIAAGAEDVLERLLSVADHVDPVGQLMFGQRTQRELLVVRVVLDHQDIYAAIDCCHSGPPVFNVK